MENKENAVFDSNKMDEAVRQYKKKMRGIYLRGFIALVSFIMFIVLLSSYEESVFPAAMFFAILSLACIVANIIVTTKMKIQANKNKKIARQHQNEYMQELKKQGFVLDVQARHISGLNTAENMLCNIEVWKDTYKFNMNNINFSLARNKVIDVAMKTETEIQQHYVSSVGGAVLGGALLGAAGAAYGGRVKKKEDVTTTYYVVFTFFGENETDIKNIIFQSDIGDATKLVSDFHSNKTEANNINIEL